MGSEAAISLLLSPVGAFAQNTILMERSIENSAPDEGTHLTPLGVGFLGGSFDLFDIGESVSCALEALAEDENT